MILSLLCGGAGWHLGREEDVLGFDSVDLVGVHGEALLLSLMSEDLIFEAATFLLDLLSAYSDDAVLGGDFRAHQRVGVVLRCKYV